MKLSKKIAILATALISFAFISCDTDTDDSKPPAESNGSTEAGGSAGTSGSAETGGSGGTGGSTEAGGSGGTGGSTASGGSTETGGSGGTGGSTEAGGGAGTGGTGGSAGGSTESGGSGETGGSTGPGGAGETGGSTEPGGSTGSGGESEGNPVLPGIKGGADNEKDTFAGKTFYDSVEKDTAESYTKYVFSTDGTVEIRSKYEGVESSDAVINYSFSEDGNIVYMTYNKISDMTPGSGKLYTYEEFVQYINTGYAENFLQSIEGAPSEAKDEIAKLLGLESYTTDEALVDAAKQKMQGLARKMFGAVFQHDLSNDAAGPAVLTERNTWGKDLSKFISLNGDTRYKQYNSEKDFDFSFECVMGSFSCRYVDSTRKPWHYRNVDSAKIYFEFEGANIEAPYTISNDGKRLSTIIEGEVKNYIDAELELGKMSLYN